MIDVWSWVWAVGAVSAAVWVVAEVASRLDFHRLRSWQQLGVAVLLGGVIVGAYFSWRGF